MSLDFSLSLMGLCFCFCVFIYLFLFASILFAFVYLNTVSFIILHTLLLSVWEECVPEKYFCDFSRGISTSVIGYNFSQLATPGSPCQPILEDLCSSTCSNKSRSDEVSGHCTKSNSFHTRQDNCYSLSSCKTQNVTDKYDSSQDSTGVWRVSMPYINTD